MRLLFLCVLFPAVLQAQKPEVVLSTGHVDMINAIHISPDGEWMATGSVDKMIKVTHIATGRELRTFAGNDGRVSIVRFSPDSKLIAGLFSHGMVYVWNIATGERVLEFEADESAQAVDFVLNGKYVLALGENLTPKIVALDGAGTNMLSEIGVTRLVAAQDGNHFFGIDHKGNLYKMELPSGKKLAELKMFDEFLYAPCPMETDPTGKYLAVAFDDQQIHLFDAATLQRVKVLKGHGSRIWSVNFSPDGTRLWSCEHHGEIFEWDVRSGKKTREFVSTTFSAMTMDAHPQEPYLFVADGKDVKYVNPETGNTLRHFQAKGNKVINMAYNPASHKLAAATIDVNLKLWNLERAKIDNVLSGFWPVAFSITGHELFGMYMSIKLAAWDPQTGDKKYELPTDNELIQNLSTSPDGKWLAGAGYFGIVKIWDLQSQQLVKRLTGHVGGIYATAFSSDSKLIASSGMDGSVRIWNVQTGEQVKVIEKAHEIVASDVKFTPDGKYLLSAGWDKKIHVWSTSNWSLVRTLEGHTNIILTIDIDPSGRYAASGAGNNSVSPADNSVRVWDIETGQTVCIYQGHTNLVNKVIFDPESEGRVMSCGDDGAIRIWDFKECEEKVSLYSVNKVDHVIMTPDHYYMASKPALQGVSFRMGSELFPFEQFDLWLNRPDIVTGKMGKTPQNLVNAYNYAHKKRVERMGFDPEEIGGDFHLPVVELITKDIPLVTKDSIVKITVRAADDKYLLDRIKVTVNDVPAGGPKGDDLSMRKLNTVEYTVPVRLSPGENRISISTINEKGNESLSKAITILRDAEEVKGNLYLVTMGVSKYMDERFNLKYAAKDARDVKSTLAAVEMLYDEVRTLELLDEQVTLENLDQVIRFIGSATADDAVIVFLAGHGVLDAKFDYYFASYNLDFNDPARNGIPYAALQNMLSSTKARRKLLFMDTCHSGEVDKDELEEIKEVQERIEEVEFRAAGSGVRMKDPFGFGNSMELMNGLFTDINTGTGATVISSSGGAEFAMESDAWQNGLFTYALLKGVKELKADIDWNRQIYLNELRAYVYKQVSEMSNGQQRPGTREENISLDFRVW